MAERTVETTDDGRYIVVNGRKWRATDPAIPEPLRKQLVSALMTGRRLVKTKGDAARVMVHDAKVALGERGDPWWEPPTTATGNGSPPQYVPCCASAERKPSAPATRPVSSAPMTGAT